MIYLAIVLICAGLACLGFVGFSLLKGGPATPVGAPSPIPPAASPMPPQTSFAPEASPPATRGRSGNSAPGRSHSEGAPDARPGPTRREHGPSAARPGVRESIGHPDNVADFEQGGLDIRDRQELNFLRDRLTGLQRIDPDSLNESLRVFEKTERETPEPAPQLVVTGVLYLDHGRKIPGQLGRRGEIPTRIFSELRRVGNGTLILENSSFLIHSGNTSYSYSAGDMDQILFQGGGLALVPIHPDRPIPVFLTAEAASVKAYIKKNARIRAL
ncbi:MAG: hypothetical protein RIF32_14620 [Leptospirales bacterium]|jgi:hypothetical protein